MAACSRQAGHIPLWFPRASGVPHTGQVGNSVMAFFKLGHGSMGSRSKWIIWQMSPRSYCRLVGLLCAPHFPLLTPFIRNRLSRLRGK
jgi:hypothetical protein